MALAELFDRVPALGRLEDFSRAFARRQLVAVAVQDETLTLSWLQNGERHWRGADLPADLCRDGLPMQRQALGELCADLLLDCGLSPAAVDLELLLPLQACQWRLLAGSDGGADLRSLDAAALRRLAPSLDWPLTLDDAYLALMPQGQGASVQVLVGAQRLMLQAWVDVAEAADLSLQRLDWLLAAAWRGLVAAFDQLPAELVWLIRAKGGWRVLVLAEGLPELDRWISDQDLAPYLASDEALRLELEALLVVWEQSPGQGGGPSRWERHWWITAHPDAQEKWLGWLAASAEGPVLGRGSAQAGTVDPHADPLMALALAGGESLDLLEERRPELGLPAPTPVRRASRSLLLQGAGWGGGLLLLALLGLGAMAWWEGQQAMQLEALLPVEQQVLATEAKLRRLKARTATLAKDNQQIAKQLVAVRSGSALLEQLRRITPQGIQLKDLSVNDNAIKLNGVVQGAGRPGPLERINALVLALGELPQTQADGVKVVKATRADKGDAATVNFSLTWALDPSVKPSLQQLQDLGAEGMAERLRLLEREGVEL